MTTALMKRIGLYNAKGIRNSALESPPPPIYFCYSMLEAKYLLDRELTACAPQEGTDWQSANLAALRTRIVNIIPPCTPEGLADADKLAVKLSMLGCAISIFDVAGARGGLVDYLKRLKGEEKLLEEGKLYDRPEKLTGALKLHLKPFTSPATEIAATPDEWPDPEPLPESLLPVTPLTSNIIPDALQGWIFDSAERMSAPPDYAFAATLVMVSAIIGRSIAVMPKRMDNWTVYPNLWGAVIGGVSTRKSAAINDALYPLRRLEKSTREQYESEIRTHEAEKAAAKLRIDMIKGGIRKAYSDKDKEREKILMVELEAAMAASEAAAPDIHRRHTTDPTMEKLGELLAKPVNSRGILVFRDELSGWFSSMEKPGHQTDRSFYLESWNGNTPYTFDRLNRGTITIPHLCLSIFGGIQPSKILDIIRTTIKENGADGLFQRLQVMVYPDNSQFEWIDRKPNFDATERVFRAVQPLDENLPETFGAQPHQDGGHFLRLSPDAYGLFKEWQIDLMAIIKGEEEHPAFISHIGKYPKLMAALALIYHLVDICDGKAEPGEITEAATLRAIQATGYFMAHAKRIYGSITHPGMNAVRLLLKKVQAGDIQDGFSERDVYRKGWSGLDEETVPAACSTLEDYGYLKASMIGPRDIGGRPSTTYLIHPKLTGGEK